MKATAAAKTAFLASILKAGEEYAGIILSKHGDSDYHLILLPGEADSVNWKNAKEFAAKAGGELPTCREQPLLYTNLKECFHESAYWSGEQHAADADYVWYHNFGYGRQGIFYKFNSLRARAVRRVVI